MNKDQRFLTKKWVALKMVKALDIQQNDIIIEIGGGYGIISQFLTGKVFIIEKDKRLAEFLKQKFKERIKKGEFEIIEGDFLNFPLPKEKYKIIGNIPYSLCGKIIRKIFNPLNPPTKAVITLPEELAEKILLKKIKPNFLAYFIEIFASAKKLFFINKKLFFPRPKVDSVAIEFDFHLNGLKKIGKENFENFVIFLKQCFKSPHKTLKNNLKNFFDNAQLDKVFKKYFEKPNIRAHEIELNKLIEIYQELVRKNEDILQS